MKIAIQGHESRGKEVIQILESLGGKNIHELCGNGKDNVRYYHIDSCGIITLSSKYDLHNYKFYTLEEFKKEFPFKIGDKVIHKEFNDFFEIISFNPGSSYPYKIKGVCEFNTKSHVLTKWQPKMKEERNITLTLDKAKEWYKKGGELKEIALQAFTEKELTKVNLPKTWEEFCRTHDIMSTEALITSKDSDIQCLKMRVRREAQEDRNMCPSRASAEAHLAMMQLEQLRNCWRQGWEPDLNDDQQAKYCVICYREEFKINILYNTSRFLSFPTYKMAEEFLECFRDLIEKVGDLI